MEIFLYKKPGKKPSFIKTIPKGLAPDEIKDGEFITMRWLDPIAAAKLIGKKPVRLCNWNIHRVQGSEKPHEQPWMIVQFSGRFYNIPIRISNNPDRDRKITFGMDYNKEQVFTMPLKDGIILGFLQYNTAEKVKKAQKWQKETINRLPSLPC